MNFTDSLHCNSKVHCVSCRTNKAWRDAQKAPEVCPHGVNAENAAAHSRYRITHPPDAERISGCCDNPDKGYGS